MQAVLADRHTHWRELGTGSHRLLLMHATFATGGAWRPLMAAMGAGYTGIALDMPGHGRSAPVDVTRDYQGQSAAVAIQLLDREAGPIDIIAHSFAATTALRIAYERPDLVRRLVLCEPVLFGILNDVGHPAFAIEDQDNEVFAGHLAKGDIRAAVRHFMNRWGRPNEWDSLPEDAKQALTQQVHLITLGADAILDDTEFRLRFEDLKTIQAPTLLVEGADSPTVIHAIHDVMAQALPNAARLRIKDAGHMAPITHAVQLAPNIKAFLASAL